MREIKIIVGPNDTAYAAPGVILGRAGEQSAPDMAFSDTYNDRVEFEALGRSKQDGTPTPENPVPTIASAGEMRVEGRNLLPKLPVRSVSWNGLFLVAHAQSLEERIGALEKRINKLEVRV